ncbi:hypothetical protein Ahy_B03g065440 [Arachis hypogaea]|uniref:MULE transposase domain-containing protein n=1 Tax=Arachis hypogaea TaxID=3818 RepID=A0A445A1L8_ARAHY|nr:hypothetical protein Ahy_B03g065440 [Arachis hypogaea]
MKEKNQNFFFELNLKGGHAFKNAFWADARSRATCEYFGDVVSFDTTYNTNSIEKHDMVTCHHESPRSVDTSRMRFDKKNEDIQSFKWLFECWLRCMGGKAPKGILTDQCALMQKAIEMCMPTTIHWWCI